MQVKIGVIDKVVVAVVDTDEETTEAFSVQELQDELNAIAMESNLSDEGGRTLHVIAALLPVLEAQILKLQPA